MKKNKSFSIQNILNSTNISKEDLALKLNEEINTIHSWEIGTATPPKSVINKIIIITGLL